MSDSVHPHRQQPTRLPRPWDSPGKNTGVGCHFLLQCMKVKSESERHKSTMQLCHDIRVGPSRMTEVKLRGLFIKKVAFGLGLGRFQRKEEMRDISGSEESLCTC